MAGHKFHLSIDKLAEVHELPGSWPAARLRQLLSLAEFDDPVSDEELLDMAIMVLQDLDDQEAGELVLEVVFGAAMSSGVRQNLVDDLEDDRPWEQFASVDKQAGIFEAMVLLQKAFPRRYGVPDAVRMSITIQATDAETGRWLREGPTAALVLRLLASGMPDNAVLKRLYSAELKGDVFPDAASILWQIHRTGPAPDKEPATLTCDVYSSLQWMDPLEDRESWDGTGWPDGAR